MTIGIEGIFQDLRYAGRKLLKRPGFTLVVVVTLALGTGATAAVFSAFNAILLRPLPFEDVERLVRIRDAVERPGGEFRTVNVSERNYLAWKEGIRSFRRMGAQAVRNLSVTGDGEPLLVRGAAITSDVLPTLGVQPIRGRGFLPREDRLGGPDIVLLSHRLWVSRFGGDPEIMGRTITLDGDAHTVVGVMPPHYLYPYDAELWVPLRLDLAGEGSEDRGHYLNVVARLAPDATLQEARAEMSDIAGRLEQAFPETNAGWGVQMTPLREDIIEDENVDVKLFLLLAAAGFLMLIAALNVANMFLARSEEQDREMALRAALGAGRLRVMRYVIAEGLTLGVLGGGLGVMLALWGTAPLVAMSPVNDLVSFFRDIRVDPSVFLFALVISLLAGGLVALAPALRTSGADLQGLLKEGARTLGSRRGRRTLAGLVVVEVAVAVMLLAGAGLMLKSFHRLQTAELGFDPENLLTFQVALPTSRYPESAERVDFVQQTLARIEAIPGVSSAAATTLNPIDGGRWGARFWPRGRERSGSDEALVTNHRAVTPEYFRTMGTRLLVGRTFTPADHADATPVVIISARMAERYWPGEAPIGRQVKRGDLDSDGPWMTIVGIVEDVADDGELEETWYLPYEQDPREFPTRSIHFMVRTASDPLLQADAVRAAIWEIDPDQPVHGLQTMGQLLANTRVQERFITLLLTIFASLGLILAAVGIYGVLSYSVSRRKHEIGLRMALGADGGRLIRQVLGYGLRLTLVGLAVGVAGGLALTRTMQGLLYGVSSMDPVVYLGVAAGAVLAAVCAAYLPARRATAVDPAAALQSE